MTCYYLSLFNLDLRLQGFNLLFQILFPRHTTENVSLMLSSNSKPSLHLSSTVSPIKALSELTVALLGTNDMIQISALII